MQTDDTMARWLRALLPAALCALDPAGCGGVRLRAQAGPARDAWLAQLRALLPPGTPLRRIPLDAPDARLLGGLDLAATLRAGRPVAERGLLVEAHGGVVLLAMAERISSAAAARLTAVMDEGVVVMLRDGMEAREAAEFGVIALDEAQGDDENLPAALCDRLACFVDLEGLRAGDCPQLPFDAGHIAAARTRLPMVSVSPVVIQSLGAAAQAFGVDSLRAFMLAVRAARAAAALDGRDQVGEPDVTLAAQLVLAPRATQCPASAAEAPADASPEAAAPDQPSDSTPAEAAPPPGDAGGEPKDERPADMQQPLEDRVLEAVRAVLSPDLLAHIRLAGGRLPRARSAGRSGALRGNGQRGRPVGVRKGRPGGGLRLSVIDTLRAAAPWQVLRRRQGMPATRVAVRPEDFRIVRYRQRTQTTTIFVVDASGSSALHRLGEAKGAVELLLADCYVRRDRVAVIAFRGTRAELLLPPTRSLVRAKRSLAGLPGGGGTPLAAGIEAGWSLADALRRQGDTPTLVLLTDGRGNVARDGQGGRARAEQDAQAAARRVRASALRTLFIDTSPRPHPSAQSLAAGMGALYAPLSAADAQGISRLVKQAGAQSAGQNG
ncbi:magnesium chelatase subunit D [Methyloversatilis sp. MC4-4]|uniref:magnesium chelatase subunit D n=1 Tax=Methyloversatilis sp. MC4-4 TaxID=3132824 RepID=UPI003CEBF539